MRVFLDEIEACIPALRRYAYALTRDRENADDLVQDCIERALRKKHLWLPTGCLRSWMFKILLNIFRNDLRRAQAKPRLVVIDDLTDEPASQPEQPEKLALAETARAVEQLPHDQREALLLVVLEGMRYNEAAKLLGIPLGTLMSRLGRARAKLRKLAGNTGGQNLRNVK